MCLLWFLILPSLSDDSNFLFLVSVLGSCTFFLETCPFYLHFQIRTIVLIFISGIIILKVSVGSVMIYLFISDSFFLDEPHQGFINFIILFKESILGF